MSNTRFLPKGFDKQLSHVMEECAEVVVAGAKIQRHGRSNYNPDLPKKKQISNEEALLAEMRDVEEAIARLRKTITGKRTLR